MPDEKIRRFIVYSSRDRTNEWTFRGIIIAKLTCMAVGSL